MKVVTWSDIKEQNKKAIDYLLNYSNKRKLFLEKMARMYEGGRYASEIAATQYTGMPKGSDVGRPVEEKAMSIIDLSQEEQWIMTIENVHQILSPKKLLFLEARRQSETTYYTAKVGRPSWIEDTAKKYCTLIEKNYGYSSLPDRRTIMAWWREIIGLTVLVAQKRGCS